jgi:anhydro-N-acetylmuramic acid kinase
MIYRVIGLMSGSSLDGLDIAFVEFEETAGKWQFNIVGADCISYTDALAIQLRNAVGLNGRDYLRLHSEYGHFLGNAVKQFIEENQLDYKVALIVSHGHTSFHEPGIFSAQLGDGAAIAAVTGLPVVSDLRAMDVALGGQGAPIVPMGEKLLFEGYRYFLNIGGIANISFHSADTHIAFDICAANRVLNMLSLLKGKAFDENGSMAASGQVNENLLKELNALSYYGLAYPKSLDNEFGTELVFPIIQSHGLSTEDALATFVEHIAVKIADAVGMIHQKEHFTSMDDKMMITGGGAFNQYLVSRIEYHLSLISIQVEVPSNNIVAYKEALVMALLGVLRWREEETVMASVTGASRSSIGGALWMGDH